MIGCCDTAGDLGNNALIGERCIHRACAHVEIATASKQTPVVTTHKEHCDNTIMHYLNHTARYCLTAIAALLLLALPATADMVYTVSSGESVWSIAEKHHISYLALLRANDLTKNEIIRPGQQLIIPDSPVSSEEPASPSSGAYEMGADRVHVVHKGESLWLIARRYGTTVRALTEANGRRATSVLRVGSRLKIPGTSEMPAQQSEPSSPVHPVGEPPPPRTHFVRQGESLWTIARAHGTSVQALAAANDLRPEKVLRAGRGLTIPGPDSTQVAEKPPKRTYVVRNGDSLWEIARRHGTTVSALAKTNGLHPDRVLRVGTTLVVPGASDGSWPDGQHRFVQAALQYQGVRYRYGGMSTRGMDCSGLVVLVLRNYGISAPHNSKALYKLGKQVSRDNLQPGDLVFFHTTRSGISHVGIYIGDGKFIHASSSKGRVRIDRIDRGYYRERLVGARRVA